MHLLTILAFAFLFWQAEQPGDWVLVPADDVCWTLAVVLAQPLTLALAAFLAARRAQRLAVQHRDTPQFAHDSHHRAMSLLRGAACIGFAGSVFLTRWPEFFAFGEKSPVLQIVGDAIVLTPYILNLVILWLLAFRIENSIHADAVASSPIEGSPSTGSWRLGSYLDFHLRHYVLVVAVPMLLILFASNLTRGYDSWLRAQTGWLWAPEAALGCAALLVFLAAPEMLRRIWHTAPLEPGPIREHLEQACERIGLRCREILLWRSDGIMINAAVMGVIAPLRFVLLSDALLSSMNLKQIEAVFGHEAGHVHHRHIQHFLLFAVAGWLAVAGTMELAATALSSGSSPERIPLAVIEGVGLCATVIIWGLGFGWLSRRFERQADLFGAQCVTPPAAECTLPCSVHLDTETTLPSRGRVCATGAAIFASALDRVAVLNGIPHEERSWRHSSIGSRIRFLTSLAGDPNRLQRFERVIRRAKTALLVSAVVGLVVAGFYWMAVPEPAILRP